MKNSKSHFKPLRWKHDPDPDNGRWFGYAGRYEVVVIHYTARSIFALFVILPIGWTLPKSSRRSVAAAKAWADRRWSAWLNTLMLPAGK